MILLLLVNCYSSTVNISETEKFAHSYSEWWDDINGPQHTLHSMNNVRVPIIKEALLGTREEQLGNKPLAGYSILDVGCGGGILCEVS